MHNTKLGRTFPSLKEYDLLKANTCNSHTNSSSSIVFFSTSSHITIKSAKYPTPLSCWYLRVPTIRHIVMPLLQYYLVLIALPRLGLNSYMLVMTNKLHSNHVLEIYLHYNTYSLHRYHNQVDRLPLTYKGGPKLSPQHHLLAKCKWSSEKIVPKSELV